MKNVIEVKVDKYTIIQDSDYYVRALRNGEEWRDCLGDNLILAMAQEIESLREQIKMILKTI